jgi:hypothetical protein
MHDYIVDFDSFRKFSNGKPKLLGQHQFQYVLILRICRSILAYIQRDRDLYIQHDRLALLFNFD